MAGVTTVDASMIDPRISWGSWVLVERDGLPLLERVGVMGERTVTAVADPILAGAYAMADGSAGATDRFRAFLGQETVPFSEALVAAVEGGA